MPLEVTYFFSVLPFPLFVALLGSVLLSVGVFLKNIFNMAPTELPGLYYRESPLNAHVLAKCKLKERQFSPCPWLGHRHVQTLLPAILPKPDVTFEREYLQMRDKGVVALDWVVCPQAKPKKRRATVLLVLPALTDGALSVTGICHTASGRGMRVVVFNRRGHGGSVLTTPRLQSFGDPSDLRQVVKYIRQRLPKAPVAAVAYGTGCGLLMSYLGEFGSSALLTVGACISPCYDVPLRFSSAISNLYDLVLLVRLKTLLFRHAKALSTVLEVDKAVSAWNFSDLDLSLFCPLYGYQDVEQFWEMNNPIRDVDDIEVPLLCINSLDDPTCQCADIPFDLFKCYPNFLLAVTSKGGHCGFLEGFPPKSWADSLCLDYAEAVVEFTAKSTQQQQQQQQKEQQQLQVKVNESSAAALMAEDAPLSPHSGRGPASPTSRKRSSSTAGQPAEPTDPVVQPSPTKRIPTGGSSSANATEPAPSSSIHIGGPDICTESFKSYRVRGNIRSSSESDTTDELSSGDESLSDPSSETSSNHSPCGEYMDLSVDRSIS
ncbi:protein ABHD15 [Aplysia californica]|uniref:Protein ABHD15 n=1 Tax=Aplysia californica TaxID=6500 RepID=A0ABM0ZV67_APLCA|nr:protein ABHD15 [Aplysia californica]